MKKGYYAVRQSSEGVPEIPVLLPVKVTGSTIGFVVPEAIAPGETFTDTLSPNGLMGPFPTTTAKACI
jgi:hypothetical protein